MNTGMNHSLNIAKRRSIRLTGYIYSEAGAYFITACAKSRIPYFDMYPELKDVLHTEWATLPERFPLAQADTFVVMPNHVHGIIILRSEPVGATLVVAQGKRASQRAGTSPAPTVGQIVGAFKSLCMNSWAKHPTQNYRYLEGSFWQRNYYEHIVRNEEELNLVREYIFLNPSKWSCDHDNPDHVYNSEYSQKWQFLEGKSNP